MFCSVRLVSIFRLVSVLRLCSWDGSYSLLMVMMTMMVTRRSKSPKCVLLSCRRGRKPMILVGGGACQQHDERQLEEESWASGMDIRRQSVPREQAGQVWVGRDSSSQLVFARLSPSRRQTSLLQRRKRRERQGQQHTSLTLPLYSPSAPA